MEKEPSTQSPLQKKKNFGTSDPKLQKKQISNFFWCYSILRDFLKMFAKCFPRLQDCNFTIKGSHFHMFSNEFCKIFRIEICNRTLLGKYFATMSTNATEPSSQTYSWLLLRKNSFSASNNWILTLLERQNALLLTRPIWYKRRNSGYIKVTKTRNLTLNVPEKPGSGTDQ